MNVQVILCVPGRRGRPGNRCVIALAPSCWQRERTTTADMPTTGKLRHVVQDAIPSRLFDLLLRRQKRFAHRPPWATGRPQDVGRRRAIDAKGGACLENTMGEKRHSKTFAFSPPEISCPSPLYMYPSPIYICSRDKKFSGGRPFGTARTANVSQKPPLGFSPIVFSKMRGPSPTTDPLEVTYLLCLTPCNPIQI